MNQVSPDMDTQADHASLAIGDRVYWMTENPAVYGYGAKIPGIVRKLGAKRVQIEIMEQKPYVRQQWSTRLKWVAAESLSIRIFPSAVFKEPMEMEEQGFMLKGWRHPGGTGAQSFPHGIWYGDIDGYQVGAPCKDEESALLAAYHALLSGSYRNSVLTSMDHCQAVLGRGLDGKPREDAGQLFVDLERRLAKLNASGADNERYGIRVTLQQRRKQLLDSVVDIQRC